MELIAQSLTTVAVAVWTGAIVFQSFFVAPAVFSEVDEDGARRFLRTLFPRFFRLGIGCGLASSLGLGILWLAHGVSAGDWLLAAALGITVTAALALALVPSINAARDAGSAGAARFRTLHGLSVGLTLVGLALGLGILVTLGGGPAG